MYSVRCHSRFLRVGHIVRHGYGVWLLHLGTVVDRAIRVPHLCQHLFRALDMVIGILLGVPAAAASYRAYDLVHHACMSTGCKKESGNAPPFLPPPVQRRGPVVFLDGMSMLICSPISHSPPPRMGDLDTPASVGKELDGEEATLALARMLQLEEQIVDSLGRLMRFCDSRKKRCE